jgi:hypothetical protein
LLLLLLLLLGRWRLSGKYVQLNCMVLKLNWEQRNRVAAAAAAAREEVLIHLAYPYVHLVIKRYCCS